MRTLQYGSGYELVDVSGIDKFQTAANGGLHGGLSEHGYEMIKEMNRIGM